MSSSRKTIPHAIALARTAFETVRGRAQRTLLWQVWERMLETEFVDRSVALAGKAFVSFFPLVIVVAAFMPSGIRTSILTTLTHRLGIAGDALATAKQAFASTKDIRRATGLFGLLLTVFYATSFVTALQRVYLRAWRRPPGAALGAYVRGPAWLMAFLAYMALMGGVRGVLVGGVGTVLFAVVALTGAACMWWFTAWLMLMGQVRPRVLVPSGLISGIAMSGFALSATIWMPNVVTRNQHQFGFFGIALALVTWFSGAAICIVIGACAGPVLAEDRGAIGRFVRGATGTTLEEGAAPSLPAPTRELRLSDALNPSDEVAPPA